MAQVIVFDVNETLLDLKALDPVFTKIFGDAASKREWFQQLLQSAMVRTITGPYLDFGAIGMGALDMVAARRSTDRDRRCTRQLLRDGMQQLPSHPEVRAGA